VSPYLKSKAENLAKNTFLLDEFLAAEIKKGNINKNDFDQKGTRVKLHGHCHQKALSSLRFTKEILQTAGYDVEIIPSGCCGMAGSFGYEAEHYDLSMKIGNMVLFPNVRNAPAETIIIAPGTSCRHQIFDGTGRVAKHWVEVL
jgi:Fe-S oxidoreductase